MQRSSPGTKPLVFLDMDDVLCLNAPYGGYDVILSATQAAPLDLWGKLFDDSAKRVLQTTLKEFAPHVVLTTSWLRFMDRESFSMLFERTGLANLANALHAQWEAPQLRGASRLQAIEKWLASNHNKEPFVILDDRLSGTGLEGSALQRTGHVVLCEVGVGLQSRHLEGIRTALTNT